MQINKIKDYKHIVKDKNSGAILSIDKTKAEEYKVKKKIINATREAKNEVEELRTKIISMNEDIAEIKNLIRNLVK